MVDTLQGFLLELGKGFAFVARQQRISTDSKLLGVAWQRAAVRQQLRAELDREQALVESYANANKADLS